MTAKMLWPASASGQCASLLGQAVQTVALALELPPRFVVTRCAVRIDMEKKQASLDTFFGKKRRRLDVEDIAPTLTADAADESNVDDRQRPQTASGAKFKFSQLILRKIIKIVATRCHILRLKYTKFDVGWGSAPDPAGGAHSAPPDPLAGFKGSYF